MTITPLYDDTVRSTGFVPDPEGTIPPEELEETRLIGRAMVVTAMLRSLGPRTLEAIGLTRAGIRYHDQPTVAIENPRDRNGRFLPARRLDKE